MQLLSCRLNRSTTNRRVLITAALLICSTPAVGEVVETAEHGFALKQTYQISAAPSTVYRTLVDIAGWWSSDHTFSGDSNNLSMTAEPGGLFQEKLPDGGFVQHMQVIHVRPNRMLRLSGALGPLQEHGVNGVLTVTLEEKGAGTELVVTYNVGGFVPSGLANWAMPVDHVLGEQFGRLKERAEEAVAER
ncbi:MAG: SRPBCC domain-containing protein [Planctomycetaceae bacterium]